MRNIKKGSVVYEVLKMLSATGEISPKIFHVGERRYDTYNWQIREMEKPQNYRVNDAEFKNIKLVSRSGGRKTSIPKTIRLSKEVFDSGLLDKAGLKPDVPARPQTFNKSIVKRNQNMAIVQYILSRCGICAYKRDKPILSDHNSAIVTKPTFYTLKEMKQVGGNIDIQTAQGRSYGAVINANRAITIYKLDSHNLVSHESEQRSRIMIDFCIRNNIPVQYYFKKERDYFGNAAIISSDTTFALKLLQDSDRRRNHLSISDDNYRHYSFVPLNEHCFEVLPFVVSPYDDVFPQFKTMMFGEQQETTHNIDCDLAKNGLYALMTFNYDLNRLRGFIYNAYQQSNHHFLIVCFDWQQDLISEYINYIGGLSNISIMGLESQTVMGALNELLV